NKETGKIPIRKLSRKDAEATLNEEKEGSYVVHQSVSMPGDLTLSIKRQEHVGHIWIGKAEGKFIYSTPRRFKNIEQLIESHQKKNLMTKGGKTVRLSVKDEDMASEEVKREYDSFKKKSYYAGKLSRQDSVK
uniref:SH2 domain-containing protein n=1 Tax=Clytia hemisphaerica TaxID=252671 RepID=A0A7M5XP57_9CNID